MSKEEKLFIKEIDQIILEGDSEEYVALQELDRQTQLSGLSFYDSALNAKSNQSFSPQLKSKENRKK